MCCCIIDCFRCYTQPPLQLSRATKQASFFSGGVLAEAATAAAAAAGSAAALGPKPKWVSDRLDALASKG